MTPNTKERVLSALILVILLLSCVYFGREIGTLSLVGLIGLLVLHEVYVNFLKLEKFTKMYYLNFLTFSFVFIFTVSLNNNHALLKIFNNAGILLNIFLLLFLFGAKNDSKVLVFGLRKFHFLIGLIISILILNLASIIFLDKWITFLWCLIILNFSVDTFAWFFGRKFGKRKLWEKVSPKKTVEGAIGGVLASVLLTSAYWNYFINPVTISVVVGLFVLASFSQIGDLIQSKIKRNFNIKDSSNLIPGHGGVYDRVDSLLFVAPFFVYLIELVL